jgi:hypothetical protein
MAAVEAEYRANKQFLGVSSMIRSPFVVLGGAFVLASLASTAILVSAPRPVIAGKSSTEGAMVEAANRFLGTLTPAQRQAATFPFQSEERFNWHFVPKERKGLPLKEMDATQSAAALALLRTSLSAKGYEKVSTIRELEKVLASVEGGRGPARDPGRYFFTVFGEPSTKGNWAWRYEGHHCALNWTVVGGKAIASSPQFLGSNPGEVRVEVPGAPAKGVRTLAGEEDLARKLAQSLTGEQRSSGILSDKAPSDIITGASRQAAIQEDTGIAYAQLNAAQRGLLLSVIREYTDSQAKALAERRLSALRKAGLDKVKFAWMGSTEVNQGHYYRIQGPTFLIEYDNTQNNANHVHSVWRDFKGDFGMDLLALHYQASPHKFVAAR